MASSEESATSPHDAFVTPSGGFPALGSSWPSKEAFLEKVSEAAAQEGFKLYVAEGRAATTDKRRQTQKVELACSKFRIYDGHGNKTRIGGCKFAITIRRDEKDEDWRVINANLVHNHPLGPPIKPKRFKPRPRSRAGSPPHDDDDKIKRNHVEQSIQGPSAHPPSSVAVPPRGSDSLITWLANQQPVPSWVQETTASAVDPGALYAYGQYMPYPPLFRTSPLDRSQELDTPPRTNPHYEQREQRLHSSSYTEEPRMGENLPPLEPARQQSDISYSQPQTVDREEAWMAAFFRSLHPSLEHYAGLLCYIGCRSLDVLLRLPEDELRDLIMEALPECFPSIDRGTLPWVLESISRHSPIIATPHVAASRSSAVQP